MSAVVPDDDWMSTVKKIPTSIPLSGVLVVFSMIDFNLLPAAALSESLIKLIPKRNKASPPKTNIMLSPIPASAIVIEILLITSFIFYLITRFIVFLSSKKASRMMLFEKHSSVVDKFNMIFTNYEDGIPFNNT